MEQNKQLTAARAALTYTGSILGAGYLSGQELWQFFGVFGLWGLGGLAITLVVMSLLVILVMRLARATGIVEMDRLIIPWEIPALRSCAAFVEIFFLIDIVIIMYAGGGALLEQLFGLPLWLGSLGMCILVSAVAFFGLQGTVRFFKKHCGEEHLLGFLQTVWYATAPENLPRYEGAIEDMIESQKL